MVMDLEQEIQNFFLKSCRVFAFYEFIQECSFGRHWRRTYRETSCFYFYDFHQCPPDFYWSECQMHLSHGHQSQVSSKCFRCFLRFDLMFALAKSILSIGAYLFLLYLGHYRFRCANKCLPNSSANCSACNYQKTLVAIASLFFKWLFRTY